MFKTRSLVWERLKGPAGAGGEAHYYGIATEEQRYGYAGDANRAARAMVRARDDSDSDLTVSRCECEPGRLRA